LILTVLLLALIVGTVAPLLLIHLETRYLLPFRMFVLYSAVLAAAFLQQSKQADGSWPKNDRAVGQGGSPRMDDEAVSVLNDGA